MNEFHLDAELRQLLREEQEKQLSFESIEHERTQAVTLLHERIVVSSLPEELSVATFLEAPQPAQDTSFTAQVHTELQHDILHLSNALSGEMQVSGDGVLERVIDANTSSFCQLSGGDRVRGIALRSVVVPFLPHQVYTDMERGILDEQSAECYQEDPVALCVVLERAERIDQTGAVEELGTVLAPLSYASLQFEKIIREGVSDRAAQLSHTLVANYMAQERYVDIENDLNYNRYNAKSFLARRKRYADSLTAELHEALPVGASLIVSGYGYTETDEKQLLTGERVQFLGMNVVQLPQSEQFRVVCEVYGRSAADDETVLYKMLPSDIARMVADV